MIGAVEGSRLNGDLLSTAAVPTLFRLAAQSYTPPCTSAKLLRWWNAAANGLSRTSVLWRWAGVSSSAGHGPVQHQRLSVAAGPP